MFEKDHWEKILYFGATEIEAVLNSRPLIYVYEDLGSGFVLTPSIS